MYLDYFGLERDPFSTSPDPQFYFSTSKHHEALACLMYTVEHRKGFAMITGEVGTGKTMLCRAALARMDANVEAATVSHTSLSPRQFLQAVCQQFGLETAYEGKRRRRKMKVELLETLENFLRKCEQRGAIPVLIVDEAQDLSPEVLEEVRLLGNLETDRGKLLDIILVGQPELREAMAKRELRQLDQRIVLKFNLSKLSWPETDSYIDHRLAVAGLEEQELFGQDAKFNVYRASGGIPRLINVLCDHCLLRAYVDDREKVDAEMVEQVVAEKDGFYMDHADSAENNRSGRGGSSDDADGDGSAGEGHNGRAKWYIQHQGERRGPYRREQVNKMLNNGSIDDGTWITARGWSGWRLLEEVEQFGGGGDGEDESGSVDLHTLRSAIWYIESNGEARGPFSFEDLKRGVKQGQLKPDRRVYAAPLDDWCRVEEVNALSSVSRGE